MIIQSVTVQDDQQRIALLVDAEAFAADWFQLTRQWGGRSEPVRGDDPTNPYHFRSRGQAVLYLFDVEAPRGTPVTYTVVAGTNVDASIASATWLTPVSHDDTDCHWWLAPLSEPTLHTTFEPGVQNEHTFPVEHGEFHALGRADPIVLFGTRSTPTGPLTVMCTSYDEAEALRAILGRPEVMLLRSAPSTGWGDAGRRYAAIQTLGYAREQGGPFAPAGRVSTFELDVPWTEVRPSNVAVARFGSTYQDVIDNYATYQAVLDAFPSYVSIVLWSPS